MAKRREIGLRAPGVLVRVQLRRTRTKKRIAAAFFPGKAPHLKTRADGRIRLARLIKGDVLLRLGKARANHLHIAQPEKRGGDGGNQRGKYDATQLEVATAQREQTEEKSAQARAKKLPRVSESSVV